MTTKILSRLMLLSWELQRRKKWDRSRSLRSAWTIYQSEEVTVYYLLRRHSHDHYVNKVYPSELTLFPKKPIIHHKNSDV